MIEIRNLHLSYGKLSVLENCDLSLEKGARIALLGPSGCGKTSLLSCIAGLVKPQSGSVKLFSQRISFVFQQPRLLPWLTAAENINAVLSDGPETMGDALEWLGKTGLSDFADKYPGELSGGMQQRVSICRALAYGGDILLMDEPLKGLDPEMKMQVARLINENTAGKTLLLVTHDESEAELLACKKYRFEEKRFIPE